MFDTQAFKQSVLNQAMHGKLTQQLPEDGNASDLIKSIDNEKKRLINEGKIKKQKPLPDIDPDEVPFEIPDNWQWVRFEELLKIENGSIRRGPFGSSITKDMFVPKNNDTYKVYEQGNAIRKSLEYGNYYITKEKYEELESFHVKPGDIIISGAGTIGETFVLPNDCPEGVINQALIRIRLNTKVIDVNFFLYLFSQKLDFIKSQAEGSAIKNMGSVKSLKNMIWQLPPIIEQQRIVSQIDKCFKLANSIDDERELNRNFSTNMHTSLLNAAMQGKLTKQLPEDGNASDLLQLIEDKKKHLISGGKIKKQKPLSDIDPDEIPFDIPDNWQWVRLGNIVELNIGKTPTRNYTNYWNGHIPWVSIKDINNNILKKTNEYITTDAAKDIFKDNIVPEGTMLMSFKLSIGKVCILGVPAYHNEAIVSFNFFQKDNITKMYLFNTIKELTSFAHTNSAVKGKTLNKKSLNNMLVPLPPLAEQQRIVTKLDSLFSKLSKL